MKFFGSKEKFRSNEKPGNDSGGPGPKAKEYFLGTGADKKINCAQALSKAFIKRLDFIHEDLITDFKKMGVGRAPEGDCGIVFAAKFILEKTGLEKEIDDLEKFFLEVAGSLKCKELKKKKISFCAECLNKTADYTKEKLDQSNCCPENNVASA